ncbi:RNA-binding protein [Evansella cellulosilytica]|uniref:RNA-binding S4 domain protein n=1 Tax=Evansella cellulosilytica (strain ATCC 21833 / DSM 2522 / FERM P-1141 / JCM 9156 / N-4) TaxID=649639 RepID=E6TTR5_EVAC2|nr:RNA-binding protein [Evansella cellulosilytica]ADU30834.1 RNA-binding S4 domain protein [Evansella cellulosilytica DSM 2522]
MSVYQHFRKDEHAFVDQVMEWKETAIEQYRSKLTDFLDPRQQYIVQSLVGQNDEVAVSFYGGYKEAERKRCLIYPHYVEPVTEDYDIALYELLYPTKFVQIEHREILGALMNVGLKREKFGDILNSAERFQIVLAKEVAEFVSWNLKSVGKARVSLQVVPIEESISVTKEYSYLHITASSLRLDTIVAEVYKLSRSKVKPMIENGYIKVNWKVIEDPSFSLQIKDVLSVRGKGRCEIVSNEGQTKKNKFRLSVAFPK